MIVDLDNTTTTAVNTELLTLRHRVGAMAMGRVLTLVVEVDEDEADQALAAATAATRLHPSRVIALCAGDGRVKAGMDAQIRVGGDAGASEIVVLKLRGELVQHRASVVTPLLLPDSPIVVWWPGDSPEGITDTPLGRLAQRRVTDAAASKVKPGTVLARRLADYAPGSTDLAWTRLTRWRALLAAALDGPPFEPVTEVVVTGAKDSPSADLLAGWLAHYLRCPATLARSEQGSGIVGVRLVRASGPTDLIRPEGDVATLTAPGQPMRRIPLAHRELAECLADELHRLDVDEGYEAALLQGMPLLTRAETTAERAIAGGLAGDPAEARKEHRAVLRETRDLSSKELEKKEQP